MAWYCYAGGQKYGPVDEATLQQWLATGRVRAQDLVWNDAMADWTPAAAVPSLQPFLQNVPPPMALCAGNPAENAPGAVTSMVCGIIGAVVGCAGLILGIIAIQQAKKAREVMAMNPGRYTGDGMATAGYVLGIIDCIVGSLGLVYVIGWFTCLGSMWSTGRFH